MRSIQKEKEVTPLARMVRKLKGRGLEKVSLEAGHIYLDETPGDVHAGGFKIGALLSRQLQEAGIEPIHVLFVDDFHASDGNLNVGDYCDYAQECGFHLHYVVKEATMVDRALAIVERFREMGQVRHVDGGLHTVKHNIQLIKPDGECSCALLDVAFTILRLEEHAPFVITVLPKDGHSYRKEQKNVRRLLRLLGYNPAPIADVFFEVDTNTLSVGMQ